jgi:hypothetical protein
MLGYHKIRPAGRQPEVAGRRCTRRSPRLPIGAVNTSLLHALLFNACMFLLAWIMWRNKWFVKV